MVGDFIGSVRATRDDNHDRKLLALEWLQIRQGRQDGEERDDDDGGPDGEGLEKPREVLWAVATFDDVPSVQCDGVRESPGSYDRNSTIGQRAVVCYPRSGEGNGSI